MYAYQCDQMLELKVPISPIVALKVTTTVFTKVVSFFKIAQKATKYLGFFCLKILQP